MKRTMLLRRLLGTTVTILLGSSSMGCELLASVDRTTLNNVESDADAGADASDKCASAAVDDGDACTDDACDPATGAVTHTAIKVDDGDACTDDACDMATGPTHTPVTTDDGDACTTDACDSATGVSHVAVPVDDADACTIDACDPATGVTHAPAVIDDNDACTTDACDPATGVSHAPVNPDDSDACTVDVCDVALGVLHAPVNTDDADACTTDACDPIAGVSHTPLPIDDSDVCTVDACDPAAGVTHTLINISDNDACTTDACEPVTGNVTHTPVSIDDHDACTTDTCDAATGISHAPVAISDNNACTTDACDPVGGVTNAPINIDDADACTADMCDPVTGVITHAPVNINDNDVCTADACTAAGGVTHTPIAIDDSDACTTDTCDPAGGVAHTPVAIDDNNACTADACDPATGVSHVAANIDDNNACTTDACDPATGAISHAPVNIDDNNACTADACSAVTGVSHTPVNVDDGLACTNDSCDPATGTISHPPDDGLCPAGQTCTAGSCVLAGAGDQLGDVIISEFDALSSQELIEIRNTTAAPIDVSGYLLKNSAGQSALIQSPMGGQPVLIPAGGEAFGVANPNNPAQIPASAAFVYGSPGSTFALNDAGDVLAMIDDAGNLEDFVPFTSLHTNAAVAPPMTAFVGFLGASTQLDPGSLTAAANDLPLNWCVSFYPAAPGPRSRVSSTAGLPNGSCNTAVINEFFFDAPSTDDGKTFIELAAPGGSLALAGATIYDVEGIGASVGTNNSATLAVVPMSTRVPVDGLLVVADELGTSGTTSVANADVIVNDADFENSGGDSVQLVSSTNVLLDALGHENTGLPLTAATNARGALYETATAITPPAGATLARSLLNADTNDNASDFHGDPSPSPGAQNAPVALAVTSITPDDGLASTTTNVTINGADFGSGLNVKFANTTSVCTLVSPSTLTCTAPSNAGTPAVVSVSVTNAASVGGQSITIPNAFTYTGVQNETGALAEVDYCLIQFPATIMVQTGQPTPMIYGRLYEAGLTEPPGAPPGVIAEFGYALTGIDPTTTGGWQYFSTTYNVQVGNDDEFQASIVAPGVGTYSYVYRFSLDNGLTYTYCDLNGAGSNVGFAFETAQLGVMTVTP